MCVSGPAFCSLAILLLWSELRPLIENDSFIYLFTYLLNLIYSALPRFRIVQGTDGKRAVLYGLVKLSFDLAYSRCCFGGSDNHFDFLEFICAHSLCYSFACTVADLQALSLSILFSTL